VTLHGAEEARGQLQLAAQESEERARRLKDEVERLHAILTRFEDSERIRAEVSARTTLKIRN
jgi:hypothetical protein